MFRVSRRVDYGLRLLIALASNEGEKSQATSRLATRLQIPLAFLHQIGRSLIQAGMLRSSPGPGGGLRLNQPAENISLLQILEALDGPMHLSTCLEQPEACGHDASCPSHHIWAGVQASLVEQLSCIRLSALAKQATTGNPEYLPLRELKSHKSALTV